MTLAGAGAALYWLSGTTDFKWDTAYQSLPGEGFTGIAVALLGACNPIANIFTGMFMSSLSVIGTKLGNVTNYNEHITSVIIAVIVYLSAFSLLIKRWLTNWFKKSEEKQLNKKAAPPKPKGKDKENALPEELKTGKEGAE